MTARNIVVYDPSGIKKQQVVTKSAGVGHLNGKYIGFIDNGKPNYDVFLSRLVELLSERFTFAGVIQVKKKEKDTGAALNEAEINKLAQNCDIILNGICD